MAYSKRDGCSTDLLGGLFIWGWILYGIKQYFGWPGIITSIIVIIIVLLYLKTKQLRKQEREQEERAKAPCTHGVIGALNNQKLCDLCFQEKKAYDEKRFQEAELKRKKNEELRAQLNWWYSLDGRQFEKELNDLLRLRGYDTNLTQYSADGGVDILIRDGKRKIIVQCKAHKNYISPGIIRELYGTMIHEKADEAWLVTTSGFYSGARDFARDKPIRLITIQQLLNDRLRKIIAPTGNKQID